MPQGGIEAEWKTRKNRIDMRLRALAPAWQILRYHDGLDLSSLHCAAVEEFPTAHGPADYALFVRGRLLGIIEAKMVTVNPQNVLEQAKRYAEGATQQAICIKDMRSFALPVPPLPEQQEIVRRVEGWFALADQLEAPLAKARGQLDALTPSLLARAWTHSLPAHSGCTLSLREIRLACSQHARLAGQLVPQDPADEPAGKLLARIRQQEPRMPQVIRMKPSNNP